MVWIFLNQAINIIPTTFKIHLLLELIEMDVMTYFIGLLFASFTAGITKGSTVCTMTCGPVLASYVATEYDKGWFNGLRAGLIFNLPRIVLITIFGAIVGYLSSLFFSSWFEKSLVDLLFFGYAIFGVYVILLGFTMYGKTRRHSHGFIHKLLTRLTDHASSKNRVLVLMGLFMGAVCLLEVSFFDAIIISTASGIFGATAGIPTMITGALAMLVFGIGSMIPLLIITMASGEISTNIQDKSLDKVRSVLGITLMVVGFYMVLSKIPPILIILGLA